MPLTIAEIERKTILRAGPYLRACELDATTADGTNPDLEEPIRRAVSRLVGTSWDDTKTEATDDDLVGLPFTTLLDLVLYWTLQTCRTNWAEWDQSKDGTSQSLSQLGEMLADLLADLEEMLGDLTTEVGSSTLPGPSASGRLIAGSCFPARSPGSTHYPTYVRWFYGRCLP